MDSLYIVVPAFNEGENISAFVEGWYPIVDELGGASRLLIVDDGSTDDTYHRLTELASTRPLLEVMHKPNGGHGPTLIFGYRHAMAAGADWIFQTDSDGQTLPQEFYKFWDIRGSYDAIFGSRPNRQDGASRRLVETVLCLLLRLIFGIRVPDANAPFRLMRSDLVAKYLDRLPADFNLPNVMLTTSFVRSGDRVRFEEITFRPRQGGRNSINIRRIATIGWHAVGDFVRLRRSIDADR